MKRVSDDMWKNYNSRERRKWVLRHPLKAFEEWTDSSPVIGAIVIVLAIGLIAFAASVSLEENGWALVARSFTDAFFTTWH